MRVEVEPQRLVAGGEPVELTVRITNTGAVISGYRLRVLGADASWVRLEEPEPRLFPGESVVVPLVLDLPPGLPAGERRMGVQVRELIGEQATSVEEVVLEVPGAPRVEVGVDPGTLTATRRGLFTVEVENRGNTVLAGSLRATDEEARLRFTIEPERFRLSPGEHTVTRLRVTTRRRWFGSQEPRPFELRVAEDGGVRRDVGEDAPPPEAIGVLVQRPVFTRGLLALLGLLLAVSVFAVVITTALSGLVNRSAADRDLALQVAQARDSGPGTGTGALAGQVRLLSSGDAVPGVSVEVFDESDTNAPLATTATDDAGAFAVGSLPAGSFKLRFRGAGFDEVWYPIAPTDADAVPVNLSAGQSVRDLVVLLGGVPATVSGTVVGGDVAGSTAVLELPLDSPALRSASLASAPVSTSPPGAVTDDGVGDGPRVRGAVVRSVPIGGDGTFSLTQVPSPGVYDLVVSKPGYSTQVQRVDVAAGEDRTGLEIQLLEGDGSISGHVIGVDGPIGGAGVVASFGQVSARTVTLTEDDVGAFTLRGLPTPGTFTVVISADGHAPATLVLTLGEGQQLTGVSATLGAAAGTLSGQVTAPGGSGGVTVTVTDGATTRQTVTQSTDPVGRWSLSGLRIPSTYTITFSRADLESQVLSVSVDGYGRVTAGATSAGAVDATMRRATGRLVGTVRQQDASGVVVGPAGNVQVQASSGSAQYTVTSASTPAGEVGAFVLDSLPPGTYTVTFSRKGTRPTSTIVTLAAGEERRLDPVLVSPASVSGTVERLGVPTVGAVVDLFLATEYGTAAPPVASVVTDAGGRYAFADVDAPAHYILEVRYSATGAPVATSTPLTVQASDLATYDFSLT